MYYICLFFSLFTSTKKQLIVKAALNIQSFWSHLLVLSPTVGETTDDGQRETEDHVLGHLPCHRHHLRGVVTVRSH